MAKYTIETDGITADSIQGYLGFSIEICGKRTWVKTDMELTPYTEPDLEQVRKEAYQQGLSDEKEGKATCQYCEYQYLDDTEEPCKKCCNAYMNKYKPEAKEEQIQVGDEVSLKGGSKGFVTRVMFVNEQKSAYVVWSDGYVGNYSFDVLQKTGKHYSNVVEVLQKMKEG